MLRKYDHLSIVALILQESTPLYYHDKQHLNTIAINKTSLMLNEERQTKKKITFPYAHVCKTYAYHTIFKKRMRYLVVIFLYHYTALLRL